MIFFQKLVSFTSICVILLSVLQMIQCNPIYPDQDWSDGGDGMSDNMLNVMPKRSFCPRSFTWNPSLRRCLPSLAVSSTTISFVPGYLETCTLKSVSIVFLPLDWWRLSMLLYIDFHPRG
ncbi:Hypothetical predicted protein [Mytilus galloprovincialis]|uniref:Secreted protein n=2 Tax=Mytilus galloprovincialis TaxID=29158 RepID=A0A8B6F9U3_MYTGA|nr:Hypothetical predicted protein [Mytilus galloprovincialis]